MLACVNIHERKKHHCQNSRALGIKSLETENFMKVLGKAKIQKKH